jgi:hypothetical protein
VSPAAHEKHHRIHPGSPVPPNPHLGRPARLLASFIVRRVLEDLPRIARALQAVNAYELDRMGIRPTPENQALVDFLKPVPRNKKLAHISSAKQNIRQQTTQGQALT